MEATGRADDSTRPHFRKQDSNHSRRGSGRRLLTAHSSSSHNPVVVSAIGADTLTPAVSSTPATPAATSTISPAAPTAPAPNELPAGVATAPDVVSQLPAVAGHMLKVRVVMGGKHRTASVRMPLSGGTVGEALRAMNITLHRLDRVSPLAGRTAFDGMTVHVTRVRADVKTRTQPIPFEVRFQPTPNLERGVKATLREGRSGAVTISERVWSVEGKVTRREPVSRRVSRHAQHKIVGLGTRARYMPGRIPYHNRYARAYALASRGGSPRDRLVAPAQPGTFRAVKFIEMVATGYSPDPRENGGYTTTATGLPIGYGAAAVDPRVIPLGTKLYVEGYGYAFACDVGGAIKGRRIDLAYDSYRVANSKGRKKVRVWILGK